jgi:hypothetical protein
MQPFYAATPNLSPTREMLEIAEAKMLLAALATTSGRDPQ